VNDKLFEDKVDVLGGDDNDDTEDNGDNEDANVDKHVVADIMDNGVAGVSDVMPSIGNGVNGVIGDVEEETLSCFKNDKGGGDNVNEFTLLFWMFGKIFFC